MNTPKLLLNEKVEVRLDEKGLRGSWHPAVVTKVLDMCREVKYDELLSDNGKSKLTESIPVTEEIDGIYQRPSIRVKHRGWIRPRPSRSRSCSEKSQLRFGVCVDALYEENWWEGVIYDYEDQSDERLVYFPDEGDQRRFNVANLRVTYEWDEFSGSWKEKGQWVLMKLAEVHATNIPLSRFIKRVWSRLRVNYGFLKMISEWTCGAASVWKKYFMEVVSEISSKSIHRGLDYPVTSQLVMKGQCERRVTRSQCTQNVDSEHMLSCEMGPQARNAQIDDVAPDAKEEQSHSVNIEKENWKNSDTGEGVTRRQGGNRVTRSQCLQNAGSEHKLSCQTRARARNAQIDDVAPHSEADQSHGVNIGKKILKASDTIEGVIRRMGVNRVTRSQCMQNAGSEPTLSCQRRVLARNAQIVDIASSVEEELSHGASFKNENLKGSDTIEGVTRRKDVSRVTRSQCVQIAGCEPTLSCQRSAQARSVQIFDVAPSVEEEPSNVAIIEKEKLKGSDTIEGVTRRKGVNRVTRSQCMQNAGSEPTLSCQRGAQAKKAQIRHVAASIEEEKKENMNSADTSRGDAELLVDSIQCRQSETTGIDRNVNVATTSGHCRKQSQRAISRRIRKQPGNKLGSKKGENQKGLSNLNKFASGSSDKQTHSAIAFSSQGHISRRRHLTQWQINKNSTKALPLCKQVKSMGLISFSVRKQRSCLKIRRRFPKRIQNSKAKAQPLSWKECRESEYVQKENKISGLIVASNQESEPKDGSHEVEKQRDRKGRRMDSVCFVCQSGDDLLPCDNCTSSYHSTCIGLKEDPVGNWFCPSCKCGLCGLRSSISAVELFTEVCYQCSRQYHLSCIDDRDKSISENSVSRKFCSRQCFEICARLHDLIQTLNPTPVEGLSWTIIRSRRNDCNIRDERFHPQVQLSQVMNVLHECFEPAVEPTTKKDMVAEIVYNSGSKFKRLDFHGFYVMALLEQEEFVCVATLRIHGKKVAEMPLIATPFKYRRRGMCRLLMCAMEKMLIEMGVERLVLPAISQLRDTWINVFGFAEMPAQLRQELSGYPFLVFNGTTMFHKVLSESNLARYSPLVQTQGKTADQPSEENSHARVSNRRFGLHYNRRHRTENHSKEKVLAQGICYKRRLADLGKENSATQCLYYKRRRSMNYGGEIQGFSRDLNPIRHVYGRKGVLAC